MRQAPHQKIGSPTRTATVVKERMCKFCDTQVIVSQSPTNTASIVKKRMCRHCDTHSLSPEVLETDLATIVKVTRCDYPPRTLQSQEAKPAQDLHEQIIWGLAAAIPSNQKSHQNCLDHCHRENTNSSCERKASVAVQKKTKKTKRFLAICEKTIPVIQ